MGMQIMGRRHADFAVLQLAHSYEQAKVGAKADAATAGNLNSVMRFAERRADTAF